MKNRWSFRLLSNYHIQIVSVCTTEAEQKFKEGKKIKIPCYFKFTLTEFKCLQFVDPPLPHIIARTSKKKNQKCLIIL